MRALTTDFGRGDLRPYFLWDEDVSVDELRAVLARSDGFERDRLFGKMLREYRVEDALEPALAKDGGCTPATLAWLLSQIEIPDGVALPAGVQPAELRTYVAELIARLRRAAVPAPPG